MQEVNLHWQPCLSGYCLATLLVEVGVAWQRWTVYLLLAVAAAFCEYSGITAPCSCFKVK